MRIMCNAGFWGVGWPGPTFGRMRVLLELRVLLGAVAGRQHDQPRATAQLAGLRTVVVRALAALLLDRVHVVAVLQTVAAAMHGVRVGRQLIDRTST